LGPFQRHYEPMQPDEGDRLVRLDTTKNIDACVQQALAAIQEQGF
jgi:hypothetical protein